MIKNLEYIDDLRYGDLSKEEIAELNSKIINDPEFAEDLAFCVALEQLGKSINLLNNKP